MKKVQTLFQIRLEILFFRTMDSISLYVELKTTGERSGWGGGEIKFKLHF